MEYIDLHAHVFPAKIAAKAVTFLEEYYENRWSGDGSVENLLDASEKAGISRTLIFSCATKPEQVTAANDYLYAVSQKYPDKFFAFGTIHPDFKDIDGELSRIRSLGMKGIKIHPDFQKIYIDEPRMMKIYESAGDLPVTIHMGDNRTDFSSPYRLARVLDRFPSLKVIAAHFGGYSEWDQVWKYLVGRDLWFDTSSTLWCYPPEEVRKIALAHGTDKILFGSDFPARLPGEAIEEVLQMGLPEEDNEKIFHLNARKLFDL